MSKVMTKKRPQGLFSKQKIQVGRKAMLEFRKAPVGKVDVEVRIKDVKSAYGNERFLVSPISGKGEMWVQKLKFI